MTEVIAVFDIGKTNKKILLFDNRFQLVYKNEGKFPTINDEDGFECDDIQLITTWMKESLEKIVNEQKYDLVAVNFSTYGASLMFLDGDGKRLTPVYNYLKEISPSIQKNLFEEYGGQDEFCRKTASPALGLLLNSGIQILWLQKEKPEVIKMAKSILHFPQYLSYVLCGQIVSEPTSIGCHTFMWDFDRMKYHQWLAEKGIKLPEPINNDVTFTTTIAGKDIQVGTGIHDSSASLVPYLKGSSENFILVSTGTWCINMNPFNKEPLTAEQLEQDCLCYLTPNKEQVKSSRLFMGHFHEVWVEKLGKHFNTNNETFKSVGLDKALVVALNEKYSSSVFFPYGKESFEAGLESVDLNRYKDYYSAYTKLMIDLTALCVISIKLVIPANDNTEILYVTGGFSRNPIFMELLRIAFPDKRVLQSEIDNASALGTALVIANTFSKSDTTTLDLNIKD